MFNFNLRKNYNQQQQQTSQPQSAQALSASSRTLLEPKEIEINGQQFIISKMPCTVAQEVIFNLPNGLIPIMSDFKKAEEQAFKMLAYCERVYTDGRSSVPLISKAIIDNHVNDFDTLRKLEWECLQYNFSFFMDGRALNFLNEGISLAKSNLSEILTDLLGRLSQQGGRHYGSLNTDTY